MPLVKVFGYDYVTLNPRYSKVHWTEITKIIRHTYGYHQIDDPDTVKEVLYLLFNYLVECFEDIIEANRRINFLLFVHRIHEASVFITQEIQNNNDSNVYGFSKKDAKELPSVRRVLKLIIEEVLVDSFDEEINVMLIEDSQSTVQNVAVLDELIYIGTHTLEIIEQINSATMFKKSITLKSHRKNQLIIKLNNPDYQIFEAIKINIFDYSTTYYHDVNDKLDRALHDSFCVDLDSFQRSLPQALGSLIVSKVDFLNEQNFSACSKHDVQLFYDGLTINSSNKLPLDKSFVKMQENNRLMYRPIIEFKDKDGNQYWILGLGKTIESIHALRTNAVLWGKLPVEWKKKQNIKSFEKEMEKHRENAMMKKVTSILYSFNLKFCVDVKSLMKSSGQGVNINTADLGQIDLLFLNEKHKKIYVCECKNNRPRFDTYNWKSDYDQFTSPAKKRNYEKQLTNKYNCVLNSKELVQEHFNYIFKETFDFTDWSVEGLFILMAPSIYKYDGLFLVLTVEDLSEFIKDDFSYSYGIMRFERKDGSFYEVHYPYFKNIKRLVEEGAL